MKLKFSPQGKIKKTCKDLSGFKNLTGLNSPILHKTSPKILLKIDDVLRLFFLLN